MKEVVNPFLKAIYQHPSFNNEGDDAVMVNFDTGISAKPALNLQVHRVLYHYCQSCQVSFELGGNTIHPSQVLGQNQFLPIVGLDAMRVWQTLGQGASFSKLGITDSFNADLSPDPRGLFGMSCTPPSIQSDLTSTLRLLVWTLSARRVLGLKLNATVDLSKLVSAWNRNQFQIKWDDPILPQIPVPDDFDPEYFTNEFMTTLETVNLHKPNFDKPIATTDEADTPPNDNEKIDRERTQSATQR